MKKITTLEIVPIGVIYSPFRSAEGTPIQPVTSGGAEGRVVVLPEFVGGLQDLAGFERIWLVYWFDRSRPSTMKVVPFRDSVERGVFSTRAPSRPNPLGISVVRLDRIERDTLYVRDLDILDATPLIDIKPYVPEFDAFRESRSGWLSEQVVERSHADSRFDVENETGSKKHEED
jgi:tRNA-Thr(GGU) m(6)t(6)A37 methyltransferase TsaA